MAKSNKDNIYQNTKVEIPPIIAGLQKKVEREKLIKERKEERERKRQINKHSEDQKARNPGYKTSKYETYGGESQKQAKKRREINSSCYKNKLDLSQIDGEI